MERIPHQEVPQPHPPQGVTGSQRAEVLGTSPTEVPIMDADNEPAPPTIKDIPKNRGRRVYTVGAIIIVSLFALLLLWMFVDAGQELVEEQPIPVEVPD